MNGATSRSAALLGEAAMRRLETARVAVIGVGGVGSWCAEALVRTGLKHVTLVDDDLVAPSNLNRQCPALAATVGEPKVEAMKARLTAIAPDCEVTALNARFPSDFRFQISDFKDCGTSSANRQPAVVNVQRSTFNLQPLTFNFQPLTFNFIVDAIDSVDCKAELILAATEAGVPIVSSMGAALRFDPTKVTVKRFDRVEGDGLARALRQRFRKLGRFPAAKFPCVCSTEPPAPRPRTSTPESPAPKGSLMPVTCAFGMALASEVLRGIVAGR